jgi:hypothetical protein
VIPLAVWQQPKWHPVRRSAFFLITHLPLSSRFFWWPVVASVILFLPVKTFLLQPASFQGEHPPTRHFPPCIATTLSLISELEIAPSQPTSTQQTLDT